MKNAIRIIVKGFCLFLLCSVFSLNAQEVASHDVEHQTEVTYNLKTYTVSGKVLDQDDLPLLGVNVVLKGSSKGTVTDSNGTFKFPKALEAGDILVFSYIGYNPKEYKITESESDTIEVNIAFSASDISLMGAVEVTGVYKSKRNIFQKFIGLFK